MCSFSLFKINSAALALVDRISINNIIISFINKVVAVREKSPSISAPSIKLVWAVHVIAASMASAVGVGVWCSSRSHDLTNST